MSEVKGPPWMEAWSRGWDARFAGLPKTANKEKTPDFRRAWEWGWNDAGDDPRIVLRESRRVPHVADEIEKAKSRAGRSNT